MAVPVITKIGAGNSKSTITSGVSANPSPNSFNVGDYVAVVFAMDPSAAAVSFSTSGGTATLGAWTTVEDATLGSGTSGVRGVYARARVTGAGTITTVTVTHGTGLAARCLDIYVVTGASATTPIAGHSNDSAGSASFTPSPTGVDAAMHVGACIEAATGGTCTWTLTTTSGSWTNQSQETTSVGTSGGGGASNISIGCNVDTQTSIIGSNTAPASIATAGRNVVHVCVLWAADAPAAAVSLIYSDRRVRQNALLRR